MAPKRVDHLGPGAFGEYRGHSNRHEDGNLDHFEYDGSIIPLEKYVGHSKVEKDKAGGSEGGGGGASVPGLGPLLLMVLGPLLFLLGLVALAVCPGFWLLWRTFRKRSEATDPSEQSKFVGGGWVLLAVFMLVFSLGAVGDAISQIEMALNSTTPAGARYGHLIVFAITASWAGSLVLGAIDLLRKNRKSTIVGVVTVLGGLWVFGFIVAYLNFWAPRSRNSAASSSVKSNNIALAPPDPGAQNKDAPQVSGVSAILPQQTQTITIQGSGFGTRSPYVGDSSFIRVTDLTDPWNAGSSRDFPPDQITLSIASWTDKQIVISGFSGAYGNGHYLLRQGQQVRFQVWNPQTGLGPAVSKAPVEIDTIPD